MPDIVDPYQSWLGFSPFEPPPTHYRLLGLKPFEASLDVIEQSVIRLTTRVKALALEQPKVDARHLFKDIAAAKACLLDQAAKQAYDNKLRATMPGLAALSEGAAKESPPAATSEPESGTSIKLEARLTESAETQIFRSSEGDSSSFSVLGSKPASGEPGSSSSSNAGSSSGSGGTSADVKTSRTKLIGEYAILERVGVGGMGQVFKAQHRKSKRIVAIKILAPSAMRSAESVRRFYREVESAAHLTHPNIVSAFDAGEQNGIHYLVMEFVDGQDLSQLLKQRAFIPWNMVVNCIRQAALGFEYAHSQGIVHRDIKPANLLLDKRGIVKILDMGLASNNQSITVPDQGRGLTTTGQIMGTVDYMSPEQAEDTHQADARSDIYSLGCTLFRLLTNQLPYKGDTVMKKILAHRSEPVPSIREIRSDVPELLDRTVQKMLAKQPSDRQASMREVIKELDEAVKLTTRQTAPLKPASPSKAPPSSSSSSSTTVSIPSPSQRSPPRKAKQPGHEQVANDYLETPTVPAADDPSARNRWLIIVGVSAGLIGLGLLLWALIKANS